MLLTKIFNVLLVAGAIQGFMFNMGTFLARKKIEKPILFLNLVVFFLSMNNLQAWLIDTVFDRYPLAPYFMVPWYVLIVPMFYAFLVYYLGIEKKRWPFLIVTLVIFLMELIARFSLIVLVGYEVFTFQVLEVYNVIEDMITIVYSLFLFFKAIQLLFRYEGLYKDILSYDNLQWIKSFMKMGGVVILLWVVAIGLNIFSTHIKAPYSYYPLRLGSSVLLYWIGYQGFFRYVVLKDRIVLRRDIHNRVISNKSLLEMDRKQVHKSKEEVAAYQQLMDLVKAEQLFTDPNLSLTSLAEKLPLSANRISQLINQHGDQNFSDFINAFRVRQAQLWLTDPEFKNYTIVAIGLECGFNSKSTFYTAFKKFTSQTPSEYRKSASIND
ncbi:helix-turn-helix domain-containing protein [Croceiramulus getboli]|nr:helix-turn-helix transcriptional regulator [Flavobacteriaceae bacterium YJPT1-3]